MKTVRNDDSSDNTQAHPDGAAVDNGADGIEIRRKRIQDYRNSALAEEDLLRANLGASNADLLEMALWMKEQWDKTVGRAANSREELSQQRAWVEDYLRIARQSDRYSQLEINFRRSATEG
jgi:hypothetical protein